MSWAGPGTLQAETKPRMVCAICGGPRGRVAGSGVLLCPPCDHVALLTIGVAPVPPS